MPLDPQVAAILGALEAVNGGDLSRATPAESRAAFHTAAVQLRDPATLAPVRSTEDIEIPGPAGLIEARVYRPDVDGPLPTMLFLHGGGFVLGDIDTHDDQARLICRDAGLVVVSINYRLAPESPFPAGLEDGLATLRWTSENLHRFGGDPERLVVGGDSAGANLAAVIALESRGSGPRLAAQFLLYPPVDLTEAEYPSRVENADGYFLTTADMEWFRDQYLPDLAAATDVRASVILNPDLSGAPPTVIATAEFDPLRDEGEAYAEALAAAGVAVKHQRYDGLIHGFFGLGVYSAAAAAAVSEVNATLRALLDN